MYEIPPPPPAHVVPYSTNVKDATAAVKAIEALGQEGIQVLPDWLAQYTQRLTRPQWIGGEEPIPFDAWCTMLDDCPLTTRQHWVFEQCNMLRASDIFGPKRHVQEMVLVWGKGSGKGYTIAKFFSWIAYVLSKMEGDPALHFGLARETGLVMINVAPNEDLARNVFFKYLKRFLQNPLIAAFKPDVLADDVRFYRQGQHGRYEFLSVYSRHSNASGLDGHNIIAFAGDEVDAFERTDTVCRATEIHDILRSSASTRVKRGWIGAMFSYPRTVDGFMMTLHKRALADMRENGPKATFFTDKAATWDVRPDVSRDTPTIADDYKNDPKGAAARYECLPMDVEEGFIEFGEYIDDAINWQKRPCASWREKMGTLQTAKGPRPCVQIELGWINPEPGRTYYMGGDGGISGDAFAVSVWSTPSTRADGSAEVRWCCPQCAEEDDGAYLQDAPFERQPPATEWRSEREEDLVFCEFCGDQPTTKEYGPRHVVLWVSRWWRAGLPSAANTGVVDTVPEEFAGHLKVDGKEIIVPRCREELILTWSPRRRMRENERNVAVDLQNVEDVLRELIEKLHIKKFNADPYQMVAMAQRLQGHAGCVVETIPFTQEAQFSRGRTFKALLYSSVLELLPQAAPQQGDEWSYDLATGQWGHTGERVRDRELKKLQRKGRRLDHPAHGSKDIWDAETIAVHAAITDWVGDITIHFTE